MYPSAGRPDAASRDVGSAALVQGLASEWGDFGLPRFTGGEQQEATPASRGGLFLRA